MPRVSITEARFPGPRRGDVEAELQGDVAQAFQELRDDGQVERFFAFVDRNRNRAIGIAIYASDEALENVEGEPDLQNDERPDRAKPGFGRRRAEDVRRSGAAMERRGRYELITEIS